MLPFLRACPCEYVRAENKCCNFLAAVLWITRSGSCCLPAIATGTTSINGLPVGVCIFIGCCILCSAEGLQHLFVLGGRCLVSGEGRLIFEGIR